MATCAASAPSGNGDRDVITILHTNDLHNCLGMLPRLAALIARERGRDPHALLLDAGDAVLEGRTADLGVQLLSSLRYDGMTPGNGETHLPECRANLSRVGAPVVVANVAPDALGFPAAPYLIREVTGKRVAILGLTTPPPYPAGHPLHRSVAQDVPVEDPVEAARHWVPRLRRLADLVVVLSHLGLRQDVRLAAEIPGIHLIIGGHSHHYLPSTLRVGTAHIAQAGAGGSHLGVIGVEATGSTFAFSGRIEPVWQQIGAAEEVRRAIPEFLERRWPEALEVVGGTRSGCWADPRVENPWANFVADSLREHADADVSLYGALGLVPALDPGPVTRWDLDRCLPAARWNEVMGTDCIVRMQLSGEAIRAICEHSVSYLARDLHMQIPRRFCLPVRLLQCAGLRAVFDLARPQGQRVAHLSISGDAVDSQRLYTVATSGFLARGFSGFRWFREGTGREVLDAERSIVLASLREGKTLPEVDGRLQLKTG